ncbi:MAG: endonuclease/exonuclease/phosphatase family protein [Bacteroidales bacterium]
MKKINLFILAFIFAVSTLYSQTLRDSSITIKVLTFNILHGATTQGDFNLDVIANIIKTTDPDFVALQEVDYKTNRSKKYDIVTELGWRVKMAPLFANAMNFDHGEYGNGILSKYSFLQTRNLALPYTIGNEPRTALEIFCILKSGDTIAFISTHLDHLKDEKDRIDQVTTINRELVSNKYPCILAGDFNAQPGSTPIQILEKKWGSTYDKSNIEATFPSDHPEIKIDYVMYYPKNKWKTIKAEVIHDTIASDHCAYLVTLELLKN